jgi:hypothetical protein
MKNLFIEHKKNLLKKYLQKTLFSMPDKQYLGKTRFKLIMKNEYLSIVGELYKKQYLESFYSRQISSFLAKSLAEVFFEWDLVRFSSEKKNAITNLQEWSFARGLNFSCLRSFGNHARSKPELSETDVNKDYFKNWYDSLISTPSVDLLYMLSYDAIMFESLEDIFQNEAKRLIDSGCTEKLSFVGNSLIGLNFSNKSNVNSFFMNGDFYGQFMGYNIYDSKLCMVFQYQSIGHLKVSGSENVGNYQKNGNSFYHGNIILNTENCNILYGDLTEILVSSVTNNKGKVIPSQKRRVVQLFRL